jgi:hypothetical protein
MIAQSKSWVDAILICQQRCSVCRRCHFLSVSLEQRDCSWFHHCDVTKLKIGEPSAAVAQSFKTASSTLTRSMLDVKAWTGVMQSHNIMCKTFGGGFGVPSGPLRGQFKPREAGDIFQFGVAQGYSLRSLLQIFPEKRAWAFDTFAGMPKPDKGERTFESHWRQGAFRSARKTVEQAARLPLLGALNDRVQTIVGPFKTSLFHGLAKERGMLPAAYVDIDSDLYSSAWAALDWLFSEELIVAGTVIGYDDFWDLSCKHKSPAVEQYGEARAHYEISRKYAVVFKCVCGPCASLPPRGDAPASVYPWGWRAHFVVVSVGEFEGRSGVAISNADAQDFVENHPTCRGLWDTNSSHWLSIL